MTDLRRRALESGKTVSRKAQSKQSSRASSRADSRVNSRNVSRHGSDEEDGNASDGTTWSINSVDEVLALEDADLPGTASDWQEELSDRIDQILDRKRSNIAGREESLSAYVRILTVKYAAEELHGKSEELVGAFLKSIKAESSEKETVLALKAITAPSETIYDLIDGPLKRTINDSESSVAKNTAIHALGCATFYGGASLEETQEVMDFLLEIVESDGNSVNSGDDSVVVTAALEEWGFLATLLEDMEDTTEAAMEAFVEQLDSSEPSVQIASGENIALLYEKSYTEAEDDDEIESEDDEDPEDESSRDGPKMIKRYEPYRRIDKLRHTLSDLASISSRRLSKKDRKCLHTNFSDILNSVENPTRGPRYQNAVNQETGKRYGSRLTIRIHRTGVMKIDKWWKLHRLQALRRILAGGFVTHYEKNEVIFDSLPYVQADALSVF
ncbi:hypothetical protein FGG08_003511 [Glutinoglossum americanum]|uniref:Interferon-related developmental regulator N-terminal domain-containing protein n=1 Tax=Glutinoglossum americanum TaxID=1670608 RepID=A0A9P8I742_9PEZI|nr:hypothetical protein FGG08_003511 [Glutinoglossum americanum]